MSALKRTLVLTHRYVGIAICLLFCLWFASGFVIIYTEGMPEISEAERLSQLPPLDLKRISISPDAAQATLQRRDWPVLSTVMSRPAYVFSQGPTRVVFADTGELLTADMISSRRIAAEYLAIPEAQLTRVGLLDEVDQWTIGIRRELPLQKYTADDDLGSEIYVSPKHGRVVLHTTRKDRLLAWLGAIPHWLYFLPLRQDTALWSDVVIWLASLGSVFVLLGLALMFTQFRWHRLPTLRAAIPYRGLMRWHYLLGVVFGWCVLTWAFSGLLSMEPYRWSNQPTLQFDRAAYDTAAVERPVFPGSVDLSASGLAQLQIKEIGFHSFGSARFYELIITDTALPWGYRSVYRTADSVDTEQSLLSAGVIVSQVRASSPARVLDSTVLNSYDDYYYGRASRSRAGPPLPVVRVSFDDPAESRLYVNQQTGELLLLSNQGNRVQRWLYHGLHSLDFGWLYRFRPAWDLVILLLLSGGLILTLLGTYLGLQRLGRNLRFRA